MTSKWSRLTVAFASLLLLLVIFPTTHAYQFSSGWSSDADPLRDELRKAIKLGDLQAIGRLLDVKPKLVNQQRRPYGDGEYPLNDAVQVGFGERPNIGVVRLLVSRGADVNTAGGLGRQTPLETVALYHNDSYETMELLIAYGAKTKLVEAVLKQEIEKNKRSCSGCPWSIEGNRKHLETLRFLQELSGKTVFQAALTGNLDKLRKFIDSDKNLVSAKSTQGYTPLHYAEKYERKEVVEFLFANGAEIAERGNRGNTRIEAAKIANEAKPQVGRQRPRPTISDEVNNVFSAVKAGDTLRVKELLGASASLVTARDTDEWTLLHWAAHEGQVEIAKLLIANQANPSAANRKLETPLYLATAKGQVEIAKLLIAAGANINASDGNNRTPLMEAANKGDFAIVKLLIENGADVRGSEILRQSLEKDYLDIARLLIEKGAPFDIADLVTAASTDRLNIVKLLIEKGAKINAAYNTQTPLMAAAANGHLDMVKLLLENGADVRGDRILREPLNKGYVDIVKLLLERGAAKDSSYLFAALAKEQIETVRLLLENGADVNAVDKYGQTPLMQASAAGHLELARLLIEKGALVSARDEDGRTALIFAAGHGGLGLTQLLIEKRADINAADKDGATALTTAAEYGHTEIARVLIDNAANVNVSNNDGNTPLYQAVSAGQVETAKLLIEKGAKINAVNKQGETPLYVAVQLGKGEIVKLLVVSGANVNVDFGNRGTLLHKALLDEDMDFAKLLITRGAKVNATDDEGKTALVVAAERGKTDVVRFLLTKRASTIVKTQAGKQAIDLAAENGHHTIVVLLKPYPRSSTNAQLARAEASYAASVAEAARLAALRGTSAQATAYVRAREYVCASSLSENPLCLIARWVVDLKHGKNI